MNVVVSLPLATMAGILGELQKPMVPNGECTKVFIITPTDGKVSCHCASRDMSVHGDIILSGISWQLALKIRTGCYSSGYTMPAP